MFPINRFRKMIYLPLVPIMYLIFHGFRQMFTLPYFPVPFCEFDMTPMTLLTASCRVQAEPVSQKVGINILEQCNHSHDNLHICYCLYFFYSTHIKLCILTFFPFLKRLPQFHFLMCPAHNIFADFRSSHHF